MLPYFVPILMQYSHFTDKVNLQTSATLSDNHMVGFRTTFCDHWYGIRLWKSHLSLLCSVFWRSESNNLLILDRALITDQGNNPTQEQRSVFAFIFLP